jgi:hypothetical protein
MKPVSVMLLAVLMAVFMASSSEAGWLVYHEPEYKGKVIDVESKQPIEGAVVVVERHAECLGLGHGGSVTINIKESLTDKNGEFDLKSKITFYMLPWCSGGYTTFTIFKPGYASVSGMNLEAVLSGEKAHEVELPWFYNKDLKFTIAQRLIGLPKVRTREDRRANISSVSPMPNEFLEKQINLIRLINEEEEAIGLQKSDPYKAREFILNGGRK